MSIDGMVARAYLKAGGTLKSTYDTLFFCVLREQRKKDASKRGIFPTSDRAGQHQHRPPTSSGFLPVVGSNFMGLPLTERSDTSPPPGGDKIREGKQGT